jgi:hypothetical protein
VQPDRAPQHTRPGGHAPGLNTPLPSAQWISCEPEKQAPATAFLAVSVPWWILHRQPGRSVGACRRALAHESFTIFEAKLRAVLQVDGPLPTTLTRYSHPIVEGVDHPGPLTGSQCAVRKREASAAETRAEALSETTASIAMRLTLDRIVSRRATSGEGLGDAAAEAAAAITTPTASASARRRTHASY